MEPQLEIIGQEWKARSRDLADWAMNTVVNRYDVWGQYTGKPGANKALTLPQKSRRDGSDMVTLDKLTRHFGSLRRNHLIGLHAQSEVETCKWLAVDIDLHESEPSEADDLAARNFAAARGWWDRLVGEGFDPFLLDSNGKGGFHLWLLLSEDTPMQVAHSFAQNLVRDWEAKNLDFCPETFPKSPRLKDDKLGAWLRLPGLHHTLDHFTRVWSGDEWLEDPWLDGNEAIEVILGTKPARIPTLAESGTNTKSKSGKKRKSAPVRSSKRPRICVDLDGVLASYSGWKGLEHFGAPIAGAVDFTRELSGWAEVVIFTSRCQRNDNKYSIAERKKLVAQWLDENGFSYDEIYTGQGKPFATAYIDDRGVSCQPQKDGIVAFDAALTAAKELSEPES